MSLPKNEDLIKTTFSSPDLDRGSNSRCAILTGAGRSAVAVVGVNGPTAAAAIAEGFKPFTSGPMRVGQIRFGNWNGESVIVTPMTDDSYEIHCHGGPLAANRIVEDLSRWGIRSVPSRDWGAEQRPLLIREAQHVLARCLTARTAAVALDQTRGAMLDWCERLMRELRALETPTLPPEFRERINVVADRGDVGTRIDIPFRVVFAGPPNVGKSSLVNAIVGYDRSITMDIAGTTRDVLHAETVIDGLPIRLSDTAGMRASSEPIEQQGIEFAKKAVAAADLVVVVSDPGNRFSEDLGFDHSINVLNKADLLKSQPQTDVETIRTVAITGEGVPQLMNAIAEALAKNFPSPGDPVPLTNRQLECLQQASHANDAASAIDHLQMLLSLPEHLG